MVAATAPTKELKTFNNWLNADEFLRLAEYE